MTIIVGRSALNHNLGKGTDPSQTDLDIWTNSEDIYNSLSGIKGFDPCLIPLEIMEYFSEDSKNQGYATLNDLLAIKLSHLQYDIFWWKHVQDVLSLRKQLHSKGIFETNNILRFALEEHWKSEFENEKSHLSLYKSKDEFFDDFVEKKYEHDRLHEMVASYWGCAPTYTLCLREGQSVFVDKDKFFNLSPLLKVRMFKEEISVIALERYLIPSLTNSKLPNIIISQAWNKALHKTVTRLTKGWASKFIIDNLESMLKPLNEEILNVLSILNLKENYMSNKVTLDEFKSVVFSKLTPDYRGWHFRNVDMQDQEAVEQATHGWLEDSFTEIILEGDKHFGIELLAQDGGGEGGSEDCYSVLKVDGTIYKVYYNYYSHQGYDFDGVEVRVVKPVERTVTFYE